MVAITAATSVTIRTGAQGVKGPPGTAALHAPTHSAGGTDQITVENLATDGTLGQVPASDGAGGLVMINPAGGGNVVSPGGETAGQIAIFLGSNSIDESSLSIATVSGHISDTNNPHSTTAADVGAEPAGSVATHAADPNAHHDEIHTIASHLDTSATGAQLDTLTDGSDADALHVHAIADAHIADVTTNPHDVTAAQVGAEPAGAVAAHNADTGAHATLPVENLATVGSAGQVPTSDGLGGLTMQTPSPGVTDHLLLSNLTPGDAGHTDLQLRSEKDAASGYAGLDGSSKLDGAQQTYGATANTACEGDDARLSDARVPTGAAGGDLGGTYPNPTVNDGADSTAIHDNIAAEISGITEKLTPTGADWILIEDAADSDSKKKIMVGNLPTSGGGEANDLVNAGTGVSGVASPSKIGANLQARGHAAASSKVSIGEDLGNNNVTYDIVEANIVHQNLSGAGTNTHAQIDTHISSTANPHQVSLQQGYNQGQDVITSDANGAVNFQRGTTGGDDDIVLEVSNGAGSPTFTVCGDGCANGTELTITHVAADADTHAVIVDVDAAGLGDVKAIDISYATGGIGPGIDEEGVLINVDESTSTGGRFVGFEVIGTDFGAAELDGLEVGAGVAPVIQISGSFGDLDSILVLAVDQTAALSGGGGGGISIFVADNDTITIGDVEQFEEVEFLLDTPASGSGVAPVFEYSTGVGTWGTFSPADGTDGFRNTGAIAWLLSDIPSWAVGTGGEYLIRITRTRNSLGTTPIVDLIQRAIGVNYRWDKDGDLDVAGLLSSAAIKDSADKTKQLALDVSGITTATTRTITVPDADITIDGTTDSRPPSGAAGGDLGGTYPNPTVNNGADGSAIHDDTAGEIAAIAEKVTPVSGDLLVIEDSADSNNKKRIQIGNLPTSGSGDVVGPAGGVVDNEVALYSGTTGKLIKGSGSTLSDLVLESELINTSAGVSDAGKPVKLDAAGRLDGSIVALAENLVATATDTTLVLAPDGASGVNFVSGAREIPCGFRRRSTSPSITTTFNFYNFDVDVHTIDSSFFTFASGTFTAQGTFDAYIEAKCSFTTGSFTHTVNMDIVKNATTAIGRGEDYMDLFDKPVGNTSAAGVGSFVLNDTLRVYMYTSASSSTVTADTLTITIIPLTTL